MSIKQHDVLMTTNHFFDSAVSAIADLSRDIPSALRYKRLLAVVKKMFPCDATVLLKLDGTVLTPVAVDGLSEEAMGRRFVVKEHPRLVQIMRSKEPTRFAADSPLPDPYDGLIEGANQQIDIHDCFGASLYVDETPWGALTLDALQPGTFDRADTVQLQTLVSLAEATIKTAEKIKNLEAEVERGQRVSRTLIQERGGGEIIGKSAVMQKLLRELDVVAHTHLSVLIQGETGVGKELVAHYLHAHSSRNTQPMIYVNCAALPENIAESELFGHLKGAFSGAIVDRAGKFEIANKGTLFLDEIGELPLSIQSKMLRALQNGEIQRVGSDQHIKVDVRIIAATNRNLQQEVTKGRFRPDLYHRLSVFPVNVPSLKERGRDILLLAEYLLEANQRRLGLGRIRLDEQAKQALLDYPWPGNVRELEHLLSRAALKSMAEQGKNVRTLTISEAHLDIIPNAVTNPPQRNDKVTVLAASTVSLREAVDQFQINLIEEKLQQNNGNLAATAKALGMDRGNFYRLAKRLGIS